MRKFLIRWWYTPNWRQDRTRQAIEEWHEVKLKQILEDEYRRLNAEIEVICGSL